MSYRNKIVVLVSLSVVLLANYLIGGFFLHRGGEGRGGIHLFAHTALEESKGLRSIIISEPKTSDPKTRIFKHGEKWFLQALEGEGRIVTKPGVVESFIREIAAARGYVRLDESANWGAYSREYDVELTVEGSNGQGWSRSMRFGDPVPASSRRYVMTPEGYIYEGNDLSDSLSAPHNRWAPLGLFPQDLDYEKLLALRIEQAGRPPLRVARFEDGGDNPGHIAFDKPEVERLSRMLFDLEAGKFVRGNMEPAKLSMGSDPVIKMEAETVEGKTFHCLLFDTEVGYHAVSGENLLYLAEEKLTGIFPLLAELH